MKVSNTTFCFVLSSPLLINNENVPSLLLTFAISHLKLSLEPDTNEPSEFSDPASPAPVELFNNAPFDKVAIENGIEFTTSPSTNAFNVTCPAASKSAATKVISTAVEPPNAVPVPIVSISPAL